LGKGKVKTKSDLKKSGGGKEQQDHTHQNPAKKKSFVWGETRQAKGYRKQLKKKSTPLRSERPMEKKEDSLRCQSVQTSGRSRKTNV